MQEKLSPRALFLAITVTWDPAESPVATSHHQLPFDNRHTRTWLSGLISNLPPSMDFRGPS